MSQRLGAAARSALALAILVGLFGTATGSAQSPCDALGGTVSPDQTCYIRHAGVGYSAYLSFPVGYPDQQALADYLIPVHEDFVEFARSQPEHDWPYTLTATSTQYQSGGGSGTRSDLDAQAPITLDTLFRPGIKPLDVVYPAVRRELEKRWHSDELASMLGLVDDATFDDFALTDDAVIFFIGQGQLLGHPEGPVAVSVPRTELASSLA
jgi:hypothetical protein